MLPHRGTFFEFVPLEERGQRRARRASRSGPSSATARTPSSSTTVSGLYAYKLGDIVRFPQTAPAADGVHGAPLRLPLGHPGADDARRDRARRGRRRRATSRARRSTSAPRPTWASTGRRSRATCSSSSSRRAPRLPTWTPSRRPSTRASASENRVYREHRTRRGGAPAAPRRPARAPAARAASWKRSRAGNVQGKFPRIIDDTKKEAALEQHVERLAMNRIGVAIVGVNGAVASTVIAGVELMKRGLVPAHRHGHREDGRAHRRVDHRAARLRAAREPGLRAAGTCSSRTSTRARCTTRCCPQHVLEQVQARARDDQALARGLLARRTSRSSPASNVVTRQRLPRGDRASSSANLEAFKKAQQPRPRRHGEPRVDRALPRGAAASTRACAAFEAGLDANDAAISPAMRYFYVANKLRHPVLQLHAEPHQRARRSTSTPSELGNPFAGMDGKTGQTLLKTALASMFRARRLLIEGWYSTNFLGNNDGLVLDAPGSNKTKVLEQGGGARLDRRLPRREPPGSHPLLQAPRRLEGGLGQHRHRGLCRRADADQGQLPLPGLGPRGAARHRPRAPARRGQARRRARHPAPALDLLQVALPRAGRDAGARPLQAGEAPARLGARALARARPHAPRRAHERREGARRARRRDATATRALRRDARPLEGRAPRLADRRAKTSGARWRACSTAASSRARSRRSRWRSRRSSRAFVGAKHCLLTHCGTSALRRGARRGGRARGRRGHRPGVQLRGDAARRACRWAPSRCSPTSTWRRAASTRPPPRPRSRRGRAPSCRCTCTAARPT